MEPTEKDINDLRQAALDALNESGKTILKINHIEI